MVSLLQRRNVASFLGECLRDKFPLALFRSFGSIVSWVIAMPLRSSMRKWNHPGWWITSCNQLLFSDADRLEPQWTHKSFFDSKFYVMQNTVLLRNGSILLVSIPGLLSTKWLLYWKVSFCVLGLVRPLIGTSLSYIAHPSTLSY